MHRVGARHHAEIVGETGRATRRPSRIGLLSWLKTEAIVDDSPGVRELRLVVTAPDYDDALRFYRDALGLTERATYSSPGGRVTILEAGRATLELADPGYAAFIDEVEGGRTGAGR